MAKTDKTPKPFSKDDIVKMKAVCKLASQVLDYVAPYVKAGVTTNELDQLVHDFTLRNGATSGPLGYGGFPKSICTSVNEVVCHGLPDDTVLKSGDIINVDVSPFKDGFFGDSSRTFIVGETTFEIRNLVESAKIAMEKGIEAIAPGVKTGDIGFAINKYVTRQGYSTVKEIGGHGIGRIFHMDPFVPSYGKKGRGEDLVPWTCLTVEPMVNMGSEAFEEFDIPNSTVKYYKTIDRKWSAQFEHTVLITDTGYEVLTIS